MDIVTESHMAVSMGTLGGIVILHSNAASSDEAAMVRSVKARRVPLLSAPVFMSRGDRILHNDDIFDHDANPYVLVTESGSPSSKLLGYMASRDWVKLANKEVKIYDYRVSCKDMVLPWSSDLGKIKEFMADKGRDVEATVRDDEVVDVVGKEDVESINEVDLRFFRFTGAKSINEENIPIEEVLENMRCSKEGLSSEAAEERLTIFGHNKLKEKQGKPPDWQDFAVIVTLLVINSTISFIKENNAGNAAAALMARLAPKAKGVIENVLERSTRIQ